MVLSTVFVTALAFSSAIPLVAASSQCKAGKKAYHRTHGQADSRSTAPKPAVDAASNPSSGAYKKTATSSKYAGNGYTNPNAGASWNIKTSATGEDILDYFTFETDSPSSQGGVADYVSRQEAQAHNMVGVKDGTAYLGVDTGDASGNGRRSLRLSSKDLYDAGTLFVIDVAHMPTGCGTWPALWTVAQDGDWPGKGELDIIEGVNDFASNALSAHTKDGFSMVPKGFTSNFMLDTSEKTQCSVYKTDNQGCGLRDPDLVSFGQPFNQQGGGTWVMKWDDDEVAMWLFAPNSLPSDLESGKPNPSGDWGTPRALYRGASGQKTSDFFQQHVLVLNTNLCGQWPEGVWNDADASAGQDQSCAAKTGSSSCASYVKNNGDAFKSAYWAIRSIKVYEH